MESVIIICTVLGGIASIITFLSYRNDHNRKPKELKEFMILQFKSTRTLSISVSNQLEDYCRKYNASNNFILPDTTIEKYISLLKHSQETNLSEKILAEVLSVHLTEPVINSMIKSLDNQFNDLLKIETWIKMKMI